MKDKDTEEIIEAAVAIVIALGGILKVVLRNKK